MKILFYKNKMVKKVYSFYLNGYTTEEIYYLMNRTLGDNEINEIIDECNYLYI